MSILVLYSAIDEPHLQSLKGLVGAEKTFLSINQPTTITELTFFAKKKGLSGIVTTQFPLLRKLLEQDQDASARQAASATLDDYAGSIIKNRGIEFLILNPLEHLQTVPYAKHLFARYLSKLIKSKNWFSMPAFSWEIAELRNAPKILEHLGSADFIAVDIETVKLGLFFDCISFTGIWISSSGISYHTYCWPIQDEVMFLWVKRICEETEGGKIFQNGKYDNAYLLRFGICVKNWFWDTQGLFHAWLAELPKRLDFIASYALRDSKFWKKDAEGGGIEDRWRYNARDAFQTACAFMSLMAEMPAWAFENYRMKFPLNFACVMAEMRGLKCDKVAFDAMRKDLEGKVVAEEAELRTMTSIPGFNPGSPPQVKLLFKALGSGDLGSSDKANMDKFKSRHPLNEMLGEKIEKVRSKRKRISSYLKPGIMFTDSNSIIDFPIILFALNPDGTDTGRLASKEHHFWCGLQIQNIPRSDEEKEDEDVKGIFVSFDGFHFGEADYDQAEARDTAYISGDTEYLRAVSSVRYFHATNASAFFGIPYEKLYSDSEKKKLNKPIIDTAKRVNHGANYNMQKRMLLMTMGIKKVAAAKAALKLPRIWTLLEVCDYLLKRFDATYPVIRGDWQTETKYVVNTKHMLVGATGWTRYCFGNPNLVRSALNSYMAHQSQSLNAMTLNRAYLRVFYEIALPNPNDFRLGPQIHDSILFQYRIGREDLALRVKELMEFDTPVTDIKGVKRILRVPVSLKMGKTKWSELS